MIRTTVNLIGLGGIGSWTANTIARLGCERLVLFDDDVLEAHNFENQDYEYPQHLGRPKVLACQMKLLGIAKWHEDLGREMRIVPRQERVTAETKLRGIVIVAVDSAQARKEIFEAARYNPAVPLYIEAGAAENQGVVRAFVPHDKDHVRVYEQLLEAYVEDGGPPACVSPEMGGQFASIIARWLHLFSEGWRPKTLVEARIDFRNEPTVVTEPIL